MFTVSSPATSPIGGPCATSVPGVSTGSASCVGAVGVSSIEISGAIAANVSG